MHPDLFTCFIVKTSVGIGDVHLDFTSVRKKTEFLENYRYFTCIFRTEVKPYVHILIVRLSPSPLFV